MRGKLWRRTPKNDNNVTVNYGDFIILWVQKQKHWKEWKWISWKPNQKCN
jgi:hypothetical protein